MKKLEFETSKGRFLIIDLPIDYHVQNNTVYYVTESTKDTFLLPVGESYSINWLKEITEEKASEIVDNPFELEVADYTALVFKDYEDDENTYSSSIDSLYSLLFSKGVHLFENPLKNTYSIQSLEGSQKHRDQIKEAEQKTFYNPYIFKI